MNERRGVHRERGFALLLALGAVAVVLALAAALDTWVGARIEQARLIRLRVQDDLDTYSTRATVLYLLGSQRFTRAGLTTGESRDPPGEEAMAEQRIDPVGGEIALDGSAYRGRGRIRFALQDQAGRVAVNSESQDWLRLLLGSFRGDEAATARLLETLADYRDGDSLRRLSGAEQEEYVAAGLPPPSNAALKSVPELLRVLGWSDWLAAHPEFRLHEWLSAGQIEAFNPNVVPVNLLARLPGFDAARAEAIATERRRAPFRSVPDFYARVDVQLPLEEDQFRFYPSDTFQLLFWREGAGQAESLAVQLTPLGRQAPWQIESMYRIAWIQHGETHETAADIFDAGAPAAR